MPKTSKLSEFERGRIVELHKQGLLQRAIAAEVHRSKTVFYNFQSTLRVMKQQNLMVDRKQIPLH